jgi:hypothetical protein
MAESTKLSQKNPKYSCEQCNYITNNKKDYNKHTLTLKHSRIHEEYTRIQQTPQMYCCSICGNKYKYHSGLWKHKQSCVPLSNQMNQEELPVYNKQPLSQVVDVSIVLELLKQNQDFKELMIEQSKQLAEQQNQLLEAVKDGKIGNTTNHTTNHTNTNCNNKFNLNVFLNETCKDAITMDDFINSFEVTREDFLHTGTVGFVEGISTVMTHRFRDMDMHTRPLHCTDLKRETIYIKNADKWEKDDADKTHMRKAVRGVAKKNMKELWRWFHDSKPAVEQIGTDECENYFQYHKSALGGYGKEEDLKFEEKIIKNVLKEVQVDKNVLTVA